MHRINWDKQWQVHAHGFKDGKAHIPLPNQQIIKLLPGPGFGDFSHPTTRLMIEMMAPLVQKQTILDIGCGSGILSIAAAKLGASKVYCCDIDQEAVAHTQQNASLNQVSVLPILPKETFPIVLMNMISSEQKTAWETYKCPFHTLITCGILCEEKDSYLQFANTNRWKLIQHAQLDSWLGCIFKEI